MQSTLSLPAHALLPSLLQDRDAARPVLPLLAWSALASAAFGAAVGGYAGRFQILYGAVKMPLFFFGTLALSFAAMHVVACSRLGARQTFAAALDTIGLTAVVLGALAPIVALFSLACPRPDQTAYRSLVLLLTACVATGGAIGVWRLHRRLHSVPLTAAWLLIYQFTGAQMAWLLKPWVSCTFSDDRFIPIKENLQGNFYEALLGVLRNLMH